MSWLLEDVDPKGAIPRDPKWSTGPRASVGEVIGATFNEQYRTLGVLSLQAEFLDRVNRAQPDGNDPDTRAAPTFDQDEALAIARFLEDGTPLRTGPRFATAFGRGAPNQKPGKSTAEKYELYKELTGDAMPKLWGDTKAGAVDAVNKSSDAMNRATGLGGFFGGIIGGSAGSFSTRDPLNLITLFAGGVGKTVAMRVASEAGLNALVEAGNLFSGVTENRRLLGVPLSDSEVAGQIALTGLGAGVFRGIAEAPGAYLRSRMKKIQAATPVPAPRALEKRDPPPPADFVTGDGVINARRGPVQATPGVSGTFADSYGFAAPDGFSGRYADASPSTREVQTTYRLMTLAEAKTPAAARGAADADFQMRTVALDRAVAEGAFDHPDLSLDEVFRSIKVESSDGTMIAPFRYFADNLPTERDVDVALREAHPELYKTRAFLAKSLSRLEDQLSARVPVSEKGPAHTTAVRQISDLQRRLSEWQTGLERGDYPKKRQQELVKADIAKAEDELNRLEALALRVAPGGGKKTAARIKKINRLIGEVDSEISHQRQSIVDAGAPGRATQARTQTPELFGDQNVSLSFKDVGGTRKQLAERMQKTLTDYEAKRIGDYDMVFERLTLAAVNKDVKVVDFGDLRNVDLDLMIDDIDGSVKTLRQALIEISEDNNLEANMKACTT